MHSTQTEIPLEQEGVSPVRLEIFPTMLQTQILYDRLDSLAPATIGIAYKSSIFVAVCKQHNGNNLEHSI